MSAYLTEEQQNKIFAEYGGSEKNTGGTEAQIALFTARIAGMSEHLRENRKDHACRKALLTLVGKRRRHLAYLAKKDIQGYRALLEKLNIRK